MINLLALGGLSPMELIIIVAVIVLLFGSSKIPQLMRGTLASLAHTLSRLALMLIGFGVLLRSQLGATITATVLYIAGTFLAGIIFTLIRYFWIKHDWVLTAQVILPAEAARVATAATKAYPQAAPWWVGVFVLLGYGIVTGVILLLAGSVQALMIEKGRQEPVGRQRAPTWMGAIAVLTGGPLGVRMQAETAGRIALIEPEDFNRLALAHPGVHRRVMQQVAPVVSRLTAMEQDRERLASLGTMAAGAKTSR